MIKMVIVIRKDLNMRKGKMAAQAAHAAVNAVLSRCVVNEYVIRTTGKCLCQQDGCTVTEIDDDLREWLNGLSTKICVGVNSEEELLLVSREAQSKGLPAVSVTDAGITEFHGVPTLTCIAIGPSKADLIDQVTGHLGLL